LNGPIVPAPYDDNGDDERVWGIDGMTAGSKTPKCSEKSLPKFQIF
jgi:hypothetical protein